MSYVVISPHTPCQHQKEKMGITGLYDTWDKKIELLKLGTAAHNLNFSCWYIKVKYIHETLKKNKTKKNYVFLTYCPQ